MDISRDIDLIRKHADQRRSVRKTIGRSRIYRSWESIKQRCYNPKCTVYSYYGGRGIDMYEPWRISIHEFLYDMGIPLNMADPTIERIDVNKGYYPENCKWIEGKYQVINRRVNIGKMLPRGVSYRKDNNKYRARIRQDYKLIDLGQYDTPQEASEAYTKKAKEFFGEYWSQC